MALYRVQLLLSWHVEANNLDDAREQAEVMTDIVDIPPFVEDSTLETEPTEDHL